jgi:hypothetical protein
MFKVLTKLSDEEKKKVTYFFNTDYAVDKRGDPFIDCILYWCTTYEWRDPKEEGNYGRKSWNDLENMEER